MHAEGQRFESVILHSIGNVRNEDERYDILYKQAVILGVRSGEYIASRWHASVSEWIRKVKKGAWRMPWLSEAMKDVISCDKLWGGANDL